MSTSRNQKIADKLLGCLKSPDNRLATAAAGMSDGGPLKPPKEPGKTSRLSAPVLGRAHQAAKAIKEPATEQVDLLARGVREARERALKADLAAFDPHKHGDEAMASAPVGVEFGAPGEATNVTV